jgi:hypothetical protein
MSEANNGAEPVSTPIKYPTINIPGRGTYTVKFGLGAMFTLEDQLGMDQAQFAQKFMAWIPRKDDLGNDVVPTVSNAFLLKVLSACIWDQVQLTPRQLADAFDTVDQMQTIARVVAEAFSKTRWSAKVDLREPATSPTPEPPAIQ